MEDKKQGKKLNVPNLRFPEFTGEWRESILNDVAPNISAGKSGNPENDGQYNLYGSTGIIGKTNKNLYCGEKILVARVGANAGIINYNNETCGITDNTLIINPIGISAKYLYYFLKHLNLNRLVFGSGQPLITGGMLKKIKVSYPEKTEANKIEKFFKLLDDRIETQSKIIEDLEKLKSAIRKRVFSRMLLQYDLNMQIGDALSYEQPTRYIISDTEYSNDTTLTTVLTANKAFILGYTDETDGVYNKGECIILDDFTLDCKFVDFPFKVKSSAIKILTAKPGINLRYMFEYLKYMKVDTSEHKRHYIAEIEPIEIVIPPKEEMDNIAQLFKVLDERYELAIRTWHMFQTEKQHMLRQMFI